MLYHVVLHKDPESAFGVTVPDLPGCFSAGDTAEEALANAAEAIECHIEAFLTDGVPLPKPSPLEHHLTNPDFADAIWALVSVDLSKLSGSVKRINITLPERILSRIDAYATTHGQTRSGLLAAAALEYVASR
jgi:predicted RNase H-like HicB family nuclease